MLDRDWKRSIEPTCLLCGLEEFQEKREEWGCDSDTKEPWEHIECFRCTPRTRQWCKTCGGKGTLPLTRCPYVYCGVREQFVVQAASFGEVGMRPWQETGWSEYPANFLDALMLVLVEKSEIEQERMRRELQGG